MKNINDLLTDDFALKLVLVMNFINHNSINIGRMNIPRSLKRCNYEKH